MVALTLCVGTPGVAGPNVQGLFQGFTSHIERQVERDKQVFVDASTCTEWFYKRMREQPSGPTITGLDLGASDQPLHRSLRALDPSVDCTLRYPGGLNAARKDFSQSQSTLSLSLTFYEFALVGDKNDDGGYSSSELSDILESFGLQYRPELPSDHQLSTLNAQFDSVHRDRQFDTLMAGMTALYDKGYRFTDRDKVELNRVMG